MYVDVVDPRTLPGYQEVPDNCPTWKKAMIEKKNKELEDKAKVGQIQSDLSITTTHTTHIHGGRQKLIDFLVAILDSKVTEVKRII